MKKLTKVITTAGLAAVLGVSAIAAGQLIPINVDPSIKILVNGEEFKPTDANGNEVMTFSYEGTTYAPLRALAEAYGLEVGYDAEKKMATVAEPETETAETEENTADGAETSSQKALEDAEFFIKLGGNISRNAIKSRLSYLGYSEEDADYAVENLRFDWSTRAEISAQYYADYWKAVKDLYLDLLLDAGYSKDEANIIAKNKLGYDNYGKELITKYLENDGYTEEEIEHALETIETSLVVGGGGVQSDIAVLFLDFCKARDSAHSSYPRDTAEIYRL